MMSAGATLGAGLLTMAGVFIPPLAIAGGAIQISVMIYTGMSGQTTLPNGKVDLRGDEILFEF